ncbi:Hypothetical predicted protein [Olea europaea subsp. europaea]|uniref:Uncharacterized protein n=1 Tax=Olea europaea subsp. europaea TaxID=158383 RepID=A0A8S0SD79_OLEEU|nr:Hypothetical predicted protein [Olea europaea subsp. europaea]
MRRGTKRKTTDKDKAPKETTQPIEEHEKNEPSQSVVGGKDEPSEENHVELNEPAWEAKKSKTLKPDVEDEYLTDKRNLEDLWQQVFPVGTEWDQLDMVYQYNWNFSNLEDAFEEGGLLYNQKVYLLDVQSHNWSLSRVKGKLQ